MSRVWELTKLERYAEACAAADEDYSKTSSLLPLRNKVFALLGLERYDDAASLCQRIVILDGNQSESDCIFWGTGLWLGGRCDEAVSAWRSGSKTRYSDAAGGVEVPLALLYASTKLGSKELGFEATTNLRRIVGQNPTTNWPGPIAAFIMGIVTEEGLLSAVSSTPILREKQICQAKFYIGLMRLRQMDVSGCCEAMKDSCSQGPFTRCKHEFYLARNELKDCPK